MRVVPSPDEELPEERYKQLNFEGNQAAELNKDKKVTQKSDSPAERMLQYKLLLLQLEEIRKEMSDEEISQAENEALGEKSYHINGDCVSSGVSIAGKQDTPTFADVYAKHLTVGNKQQLVRMLFADFEPVLIETRDTVGHYLLGTTGDFLHTLFLKNC